jgi:hypothetical protein
MENADERLQLYIPVSANILVKPALFDGFFSPFVTLGAGPSITSFKRRIPNPDYVAGDPSSIKYTEYHNADGLGLQVNPGIGADFRIADKYFVGLDVRYFFMTIKQDVLDNMEINELDGPGVDHEPVLKDFNYDNASIFLYGGVRF